ncbi:MAG: leucyl aminopeptidase family protein [Phycisphaerales bacterium]|jgi:leucyl aminopeptidase|nr:leucyl aminopeptidase family protein [Phycisphaerales bacterium]
MYRTIRTGSPRRGVIVAGITSSAKRLPTALKSLNEGCGGGLEAARTRPTFSGEAGQVSVGSESAILVGLGDEPPTSTSLRTAGATLVAALRAMNASAAHIELAGCLKGPLSKKPAVAAQAIAEGMVLANWRQETWRGAAAKGEAASGTLVLTSREAAARGGLRRGCILGDGSNEARRLGSTPPNIANPAWIARQARSMAKRLGMTCSVISAAKAKELGMGGLTAVGVGSSSPPCLIHLCWKPKSATSGTRLALVGKTITYDTGGYSLKISNGMKGMKYDMCGGAAVLGAMQAIAMLKLPIEVHAVLPAAENMVSDRAYRPDDIIEMYNGVTVEVTNTDAEGRLVLADALAWTCKKLKPTHIIDIATLTGGVVVALGEWCSGLWCKDVPLRRALQDAGDNCGEQVWRMPLWKEHRDFMRARHADIWNSGPKRDGHPIQGAAFLSYFVNTDIPWAHVDIAGPATTDSATDLYVAGPTGCGARLLAETAAALVSG